MPFDSITLAAVAAELNLTLSGGRVDKIHQPAPLDVVFTIRSNGANHMLLASADAETPRIHLTSVKHPNPQSPPNFCMLLRKYLEGAHLLGIEQIDFDRILHLNFAAYDGERITLVVEIMGKHSNVILINSARRILGVAKPVGRLKNRYREILPGRDYIPPPSQNKINPLLTSKLQFDKLVEEFSSQTDNSDRAGIAAWLTKTFTGLSPFAAREITARACGEIDRLGEEFAEFFNDIRTRSFTPILITDDLGRALDFYAFPTLQHPAANQYERSSMNELVDTYYTGTIPKRALEQAKEEFIHTVQGEIQARKNAIVTIRQNIVPEESIERFKEIGELILAQTAAIPSETHSVELVDYYDANGGTVKVDLDPRLNAAENAAAFFRKYHKAASGAEALKDRLAETETEISILQRILDAGGSSTSPEEIQEHLKELESSGLSLRKQEHSPAVKQKPEFDGYKISKVNSDGWEILVGQNSLANDYLVQRVAKPADIWIHVKASPSAHVVIRTNGKPDAVPRSVLVAAAELAVQHSNAKHSSLVPVDYTQRRYVRKPKGSAPGKVIYQNEKTLFITGA